MGRSVERYFPLVLSFVAPLAFFGFWFGLSQPPSEAGLSRLTEGILNLAGILVGFLATAKALLYALPDRRAIKFLRDAGALSDLVDYLFVDIMVWLITAITALIFVFVGPELRVAVQRAAIGIWLFLPMWGVLGFARSMYIFTKFLKLSATSGDSNSATV